MTARNKTTLSILLMTLFISCEKIQTKIVDQRLKSYIEVYEEEALARGIDPALEYTSFTIEQLDHFGEDWGGAGRKGQVIIDVDRFNTGDSLYIEYTLIHEIGHAVFGYDHDDNTLMMGIPSGSLYGKYRTELLNEFFEGHDQGVK